VLFAIVHLFHIFKTVYRRQRLTMVVFVNWCGTWFSRLNSVKYRKQG